MPAGLQRVIAALCLVAVGPVLLAAACWVRLVSRGPAIFRQPRVGHYGREFMIFKVRTLDTTASESPSPSTTTVDDPRMVLGGRFLRRFKIDELPQLLNVVRGEMNLVGPRPTVRSDVERMTGGQKRRHDVFPGLTGLAQISGGQGLTWPQRIEFDLEYIDNRSWRRDLGILVSTARGLVTGAVAKYPADFDEWGTHTDDVEPATG